MNNAEYSAFGQPNYTTPPQAPPRANKQKILIVVIATLLIAAIALLLLTALLRNDGPKSDLASIVSGQAKIIDIIDEYENNASSRDTQVFMAQAKAIMNSHYWKTKKYYNDRHGALPDAQNDELSSTDIADELDRAIKASTFDDVITRTLSGLLKDNTNAMSAVVSKTSDDELRILLTSAVESQSELTN